jgi:hypothetical protein
MIKTGFALSSDVEMVQVLRIMRCQPCLCMLANQSHVAGGGSLRPSDRE